MNINKKGQVVENVKKNFPVKGKARRTYRHAVFCALCSVIHLSTYLLGLNGVSQSKSEAPRWNFSMATVTGVL